MHVEESFAPRAIRGEGNFQFALVAKINTREF